MHKCLIETFLIFKIINFYEKFAKDLNSLTGLEILGISHTGHLYDDNIKNWKPMDLLTQINNKIDYIEKNFSNKDIDIIFIGHSIGCYVILEILNYLDENIKKRVKKAFLLMPTIERMSETPNGRILTFVTKYFMWLIYFIIFMCSKLPLFVQKTLVSLLFTRNHSNLNHGTDTIVLNMVRSYSCATSAFYMGRDEMHHVKKLHCNFIKQHFNTILLYYAIGDRWCPLNLYYDMRNYLSNDHFIVNKSDKLPTILLDMKGLEHGFVLYSDQCETMANLIAEWIKLI